ncbi:MAG: serine/threonine-protein phosphatase [Acidimicrobiales bacterium]|nr:serine/threonine-protein phosphatase [Acidimicrobiales bacterium]
MAVYLLDVCGHGVGAALLSVSALNAIRSEALPQTDFHRPADVLAALNKAFPMERQNDMFFTAWYGVFDRPSRRLRWAGGGHPPALLLPAGGGQRLLESEGPLIGAVEGLEFTADEVEVPPGSSLFVYSDGAFEISLPEGGMWPFDAFVETLAEASAGRRDQPAGAEGPLDVLLGRVRDLAGRADFHDDFSMLELVLG